jgi:MOSC domain-containing protein YiiM
MNPPSVLGRVVSVNVGRPRTVEWFGRQVRTAIWKAPVDGPLAVRGGNIDGDQQADLRVHGGYDKAIYAYAAEDYQWWAGQLGETLAPGTFGENLTTEGIDLAAAVVGARWRVGSALLEVSEPRLPCFKLGIRMGDAAFVERFDDAMRFGTYVRIVEEGELVAGDDVTLVAEPPAGVSIGDLAQAHRAPTPALLGQIAASSHVPESWRSMAERALLRHQAL